MDFYRTRSGAIVTEDEVNKAIDIYRCPFPDDALTEINVTHDIVVKLAREGKTVVAVKMLRSISDVGLKDAYEIIRAIQKASD